MAWREGAAPASLAGAAGATRGPALWRRGCPAQHGRVGLLLLAGVATVLGFALILLAGRGQRVSPAASAGPEEPAPADLGWLRAGGAEALQRALRALFAEMGFTPEPGQEGGGAVEFQASDPTPIRGGRIYVRGLLSAEGGAVDADEVRTLLDAARAEAVGKAVLVTLGRFSPEAREAARGQPVDLLDGEQLAALLRRHLPQAWATRVV